MAKLIRKTQKVFGQDGATDQFAVFGTMKKVASEETPDYSKDIEVIQSNAAYSQGWQEAVIANYAPFMEELNSICYSLTYQMSYLLQNGVPEWDDGTTYYINSIVVGSNSLLYRCLTDNCLNVDPTTDDGTNWYNYSLYGANQDLSNLTTAGIDKLHALKGYLDSGKLLTDTTLYNDVYAYNHSTNITGIDTIVAADYTKVGSPTINADGVASGFSASNYITKDLNLSGSSLKIRVPFKTTNVTKTQQIINNANFQLRLLYVSGSTALYPSLYITDGVNTAQPRTSTYGLQVNTDYIVEIEYKHNVSVEIKLYSTSGVLLDSAYSTSSIVTSAVIPNSTLTTKIGSSGGSDYLEGSIDLCGVRIEADFGIYRPTIIIPYNESSTGSKIVDVAYRDRVQDVFELYGSANYYTIDETNQNATLPMGEVYGFIEQKTSTDFDNVTQTAKNTSISWGMPDWSRMVSKTPYTEYTATERGWINASGYTGYTQDCGVKINGNIVAYAYAPTSSDSTSFACLVPVDIGDTYEGYNNHAADNNSYISFINFIPCKGEA